MELIITDEILTICPGEELDHHQAEEILRCIRPFFLKGPIRQILFDMSNTDFIDSAGIGMILGLYREMQVRGGCLGVMHMQKSISRVYQMSGLSKIIPLVDDLY